MQPIKCTPNGAFPLQISDASTLDSGVAELTFFILNLTSIPVPVPASTVEAAFARIQVSHVDTYPVSQNYVLKTCTTGGLFPCFALLTLPTGNQRSGCGRVLSLRSLYSLYSWGSGGRCGAASHCASSNCCSYSAYTLEAQTSRTIPSSGTSCLKLCNFSFILSMV